MIYLIILAGLLLRLISINQSLWLDEATSALVAKMPLSDIFTKFLPGDFHPPFYYLILKFWTDLFGYSEISLRIPSIVFGFLTIYFTYLIAKILFNKKTAIISAALIATSGLAIYYSQEARMYSLAAFLVSLLVYLFLKKKWFIFSLVLPILAMTDYVSLLIVPIFWLADLKNWKKIAVTHIPTFIIFGFWLPVFWKQLFRGFLLKGSNWWNLLGTVTGKNIALIPVKFIFGRISLDNKILYGVISFFGVALYSFLIFLRKTQKENSRKLIYLWLIAPTIFLILLSLKLPGLQYFRLLFVLPAFYILVGAGISTFRKPWQQIVLVLILIINIVSSGCYLFNSKFQREDWRSAVQTIGTDIVVMPFNSQGEALKYYGIENQTININRFSGGQKRIWLSRYVWNIFDPEDTARKKIEGLGYNKIGEVNFNGVVFYKYENSH